ENGTCPDSPNSVPLNWSNVGYASMFIMINGIVSMSLGLHLEKSLFISSVRCVVQLTIMGMILEDVFKARHPLIIMAMVIVLVLLGANEIVFNKNKRRHARMFLSVLVSLAISTITIGIIGSRFALAQDPFWEPQIFIPTMGMLLGNSMSAIAVGNSYALEQFSGQREKIEMYLAFGASRWEAGRPVAMEAVKMAMLPTINSMSIIGLISIPGMMTGQIIGGAPISDAVKYQQIIMFMISSSTALSVLISIFTCVFTCIDNLHRLRIERIITTKPWIYAKKDELVDGVKNIFIGVKNYIFCCFIRNTSSSDDSEAQVLLN
ncbi:17874_t:CDS:10, partial [Acaulospora morrowiae]